MVRWSASQKGQAEERCQSGRMEHTANVLSGKPFRGFESLPLRNYKNAPDRALFCLRRGVEHGALYVRDSKGFAWGPVSKRARKTRPEKFLSATALKNVLGRILPLRNDSKNAPLRRFFDSSLRDRGRDSKASAGGSIRRWSGASRTERKNFATAKF